MDKAFAFGASDEGSIPSWGAINIKRSDKTLLFYFLKIKVKYIIEKNHYE